MKTIKLSEEALLYLRVVVQRDHFERFNNGEYHWDAEIQEVRKELGI